MRDHRGQDAGNPHGPERRARQAERERPRPEASEIGQALGLCGERVAVGVVATRMKERFDLERRRNADRHECFQQRQAEIPDDVPPRGRGR